MKKAARGLGMTLQSMIVTCSYLYREKVIGDLREHLPLGGCGQCSCDKVVVMSPSQRELSDQTDHTLQALHEVGPRLLYRILHTMVNALQKAVDKR